MLTRRSFMYRPGFAKKSLEAGSRKWLIAQLDKYTSLVVRGRDKKCVTCGSRRNLQCSHFYSRRYLAIRFDLRNCNAMCGSCNRRHNVDPLPYMAFMQERYGADVVLELHELRMRPSKVSDEELSRLLNVYRSTAWR